MAKVSSLAIKLQSGTDNTYYASWAFSESTTTTTSSVAAGNLVSIKSGATYYNGVSIPSWVMNQQWYITQVSGDRAVLGKNASGTNDICSPINTKYLTGASSSTTTVTTDTLDHYEVKWYYDTGDGIWFTGNSEDATEKFSTYSPPSNALKIKVSVKPVSKTKTVGETETSYWTGTAVTAEFSITAALPPENPATPSVVIEKFKLTATLENVSDPRTDQILFEIYNGTTLVDKATVDVVTCQASHIYTVTPGGEYRVRCRAIYLSGTTKVYSEEYSGFSSTMKVIPSTPTGITVCRATSETSVYLEWEAVNSADSYDIEYTTELRYFDGSDQTSTTSGIEFNHFEKTGLTTGDEYFFRVRAVNAQGESSWTEPVAIVIGEDPAAPTTWSSTTTAITGETVTLYWVHNAEDNSSQTYAEVELIIDGIAETYTIKNTEDEDEKDKTSSYVIDTTEYVEGTKIQWRVRTAGITKAYGDWSIQRVIDVYAPPTLELSVTNVDGEPLEVLESFPIYIYGLAGPNTQQPIGYHVTITANSSYETVDSVGNLKMVNKGEQIYSKYFDISEELVLELSANHVDLENDITYTVKCTVSMNSGLTTESSVEFKVSWSDISYEPDAEIALDKETLITYVRPYCRDEEGALVEDVMLSVYRREFDGSYTELSKDVDNTKYIVITDPHPALDYARYRIVATTKSTGAVSYYDVPAYPVNEKAAVIQWDEGWVNFDTTNEDTMAEPAWAGSMLKLPYNIDVSDKHDPEVSLIEYVGRKHPVSYYGTQQGSTSSWNMEIPKNDEATLYALRRLAIWKGDVYVREPSGSGYWANVKVGFSQKHRELTIPVSFDITRVEGGA